MQSSTPGFESRAMLDLGSSRANNERTLVRVVHERGLARGRVELGGEGACEQPDGGLPVPLLGVYSANDYSEDVDFLYEKGLMGGKSTGNCSVKDGMLVFDGEVNIVIDNLGLFEW